MDISVLLPVYWADPPQAFYLALKSIGPNQTYPPREIVVVKDGPLSEEHEEVLERFEQENPGLLRVTSLPKNMGLARALNVGLRECRYSWVARMDADDFSLPERLEIQAEFLKKHRDISLLGGWTAYFYDDPTKIEEIRWVPTTHEELASYSKFRCPLNHQTIIMNREEVLWIGGYPEHVGNLEDYGFFVKCLVTGLKMANIPQVLVLVNATDLVKRRGGLKYAKNEWKLFRYFLEIGFYSYLDFCLIGVPRVLFRLLPFSFRQKFYRLFLRKKISQLESNQRSSLINFLQDSMGSVPER